MGFLDKARAAATDLAAKADTALGSAGLGGSGAPSTSPGAEADRYFRDLGVLTFLEATGRPADAQERQRVMASLQELDARGGIRSFALQTAPPPDAAGSVPPPPPGTAGGHPTPPPPGPTGGAARVPEQPVAPPPPPSWMNQSGSDTL